MRKTISIVVVLLILIFAGWFYWKFYYTYSEGNRTGLLQKFSHKGNLIKTYEGELVLSSLIVNNTTPVSSEKFYFSVADEALAKKLMGYEGQRVVLHYKQKNSAIFLRGDSPYVVDSVNIVGNK